MATDVASINAGIINSVSHINWLQIGGWIVFILVAAVGGFFVYKIWSDKRIFNKEATILEIVGVNYVPTLVDKMKIVKIGSGGFEILYFKKMKIYRIGYGGRVGRSKYYFFIGKDGYWYNGMLSADMNAIGKNGGLIPIVTTNPAMRSQYTSLEKQIETLHSEKKSFMDKYGMWVLGAMFILIIGIFAWLIFREMSPIMSNNALITQQQSVLMDKINSLIEKFISTNVTKTSGLIPV